MWQQSSQVSMSSLQFPFPDCETSSHPIRESNRRLNLRRLCQQIARRDVLVICAPARKPLQGSTQFFGAFPSGVSPNWELPNENMVAIYRLPRDLYSKFLDRRRIIPSKKARANDSHREPRKLQFEIRCYCKLQSVIRTCSSRVASNFEATLRYP